jgi:hypothetical protein
MKYSLICCKLFTGSCKHYGKGSYLHKAPNHKVFCSELRCTGQICEAVKGVTKSMGQMMSFFSWETFVALYSLQPMELETVCTKLYV